MSKSNTTGKIDLRHKLLRGILQDLAPEFDCSPEALKLRYYRGNNEVVRRVVEEAKRRINEARQLEEEKRYIREALAA